MRLTFTRLLVAATLSAAGAAMALASIGCSKLSAFAPKQVCACEAIWNDPTCPNGELGADTAVFLVPCPDGLPPITPVPGSRARPGGSCEPPRS